MVEKLKPCPFCGGEAYEYHDPNGTGIRCIDCQAGFDTMPSDESEIAWNARSTDGLVGALERIIIFCDGPTQQDGTQKQGPFQLAEAVSSVARAALSAHKGAAQ